MEKIYRKYIEWKEKRILRKNECFILPILSFNRMYLYDCKVICLKYLKN